MPVIGPKGFKRRIGMAPIIDDTALDVYLMDIADALNARQGVEVFTGAETDDTLGLNGDVFITFAGVVSVKQDGTYT